MNWIDIVLENRRRRKTEKSLDVNGPATGSNVAVFNQPVISEGAAFALLARGMIQGADIDSSARYPPPRCFPGTRTTFIAKAQSWILDQQRTSDLLWIYGLAGVGKSAVAQTIAEFAKDNHRLGATLFFAKNHGRNDPQRVFITIAFQLARRVAGYLRLVARKVDEIPDILQMSPRVQFQELIVKPLGSLSSNRKHLIILDGLDECAGEGAQLSIIQLIKNTISEASLPIIWMICSRPEPHLIGSISGTADSAARVWIEDLAIDTEESREDTTKFIRARFKWIQKHYREFIEEDVDGCWPAEGDLEKIINATSGFFAYASDVLNFIQDPGRRNPAWALRYILAFIDNPTAISLRTNPFRLLDLPYTEILSTLPTVMVPATMFLLGICALYPPLPAEHLRRFLRRYRGDFRTTVGLLHSVIHVPEPEDAFREPLRFFHPSFVDFLMNPIRSQRFSLKPPSIHLDVAEKCLQVLCKTRMTLAKGSSGPPDLVASENIYSFAAANVWSACVDSEATGDLALLGMILELDFRSLRVVESSISTPKFRVFVRWLCDKLHQYSKPLIVQIGRSVTWTDDYLQVIPFASNGHDEYPDLIADASYVAIGEGSKAVVILLDQEHIIIV